MYNKRRCIKNRFLEEVETHITRNFNEYVIAVIVFIVGVVLGVLLLNNSNLDNKSSLSGYINEFIQIIKNGEYQIDQKKLFIQSVLNNLELGIIIFISGTTIIGIPLIYGGLIYKGICLGYSISAIVVCMEKWKAVIFVVGSMLLHNIIAIPCLLAIVVSSKRLYNTVWKNRNLSQFKSEIYRHIVFSIFMFIGLIFSSLIEVFLSTNITSSIITGIM